MRYPKPEKPAGLQTPGLEWSPRAARWVAYWTCRRDIRRRGYPLTLARLWPSTGTLATEPTPDDWLAIASACRRLQDEMLEWANGGSLTDARSVFDGSVASLIRIYLGDPDSPFQVLRHHTKQHYESNLRTLTGAIGHCPLAKATFRDLRHWYAAFRAPAAEGEPDRAARAHGLMVMLRQIMRFGTMLELADCARLKAILDEMEFEMPKARTAFITAGQVAAVRRQAHAAGFPSIALAQAVQFELMVRQKDVIGEWIPVSEPGLSDVVVGGRKWMLGIRWSDINSDLILQKVSSKSLRGRRAVVTPNAGKLVEFDLRAYPMIMEELAGAARPADTAAPLVLCEYTGLPWRSKPFQKKWRDIADAAGIPATVQNRDSRAGGITEATDAIAAERPDFEAVRRHAGHSQPSTTARYSRSHLGAKNTLAEMRSKGRKP